MPSGQRKSNQNATSEANTKGRNGKAALQRMPIMVIATRAVESAIERHAYTECTRELAGGVKEKKEADALMRGQDRPIDIGLHVETAASTLTNINTNRSGTRQRKWDTPLHHKQEIRNKNDASHTIIFVRWIAV